MKGILRSLVSIKAEIREYITPPVVTVLLYDAAVLLGLADGTGGGATIPRG